MLEKYTRSLEPLALPVLRIIVGMTFLLHGMAKLPGLGGFSGFLGSMGVPAAELVGPLVAYFEIIGGLLLIVGLATRGVAGLFVLMMLVTTLMVKAQMGFIAQQGAGAELDLLLAAAAFVLFASGPGQLSVERNLLRREI